MSTERTSDRLLRLALIALAVIVLFPLSLIFALPMMGMMGWWWNGGVAGGLSPLWGVGMMLVWFAVLLAIGYLLYRSFVGGVRSSVTADRALEELRVAYARGELSDEEFEERRAKLSRDESRDT